MLRKTHNYNPGTEDLPKTEAGSENLVIVVSTTCLTPSNEQQQYTRGGGGIAWNHWRRGNRMKKIPSEVHLGRVC